MGWMAENRPSDLPPLEPPEPPRVGDLFTWMAENRPSDLPPLEPTEPPSDGFVQACKNLVSHMKKMGDKTLAQYRKIMSEFLNLAKDILRGARELTRAVARNLWGLIQAAYDIIYGALRSVYTAVAGALEWLKDMLVGITNKVYFTVVGFAIAGTTLGFSYGMWRLLTDDDTERDPVLSDNQA